MYGFMKGGQDYLSCGIDMKGNELFNIEGKKAIVTGGTRGLGYGMAEGLMEAGCEVAIVGTSDKVHETAEQFRERGFKCHGVKANLAIREEVYSCFRECVEKLGKSCDSPWHSETAQCRGLPSGRVG